MDGLVSIDEPNNKRTLTEQLKSHFNLRDDPFSSDNKCFFEGGQRKHNIETLRHLAIFGDMILLLTGDVGAGKTSLINHFIAVQSDELSILFHSKGPQEHRGKYSESNVQNVRSVNHFAALAKLKMVDGESESHTLSRLLQRLELKFQETGKRTVFIVDEAHLLSKEELVLYLSVFRGLPVESGVVLLLSGTPKLLDIALKVSSTGREGWLHQIQLKPFSHSETVEYLQCSLLSVGYSDPLLLSEDQLESLAKISKGLPGRINRFFAYVVFELGLPETDKPNVNNVAKKVLLSIAALLFGSFLLVSYQHGLLNLSVFDSKDLVEHKIDISEKERRREREAESLMEKQRVARLKMLERAIEVSAPQDAVATVEVKNLYEEPELLVASDVAQVVASVSADKSEEPNVVGKTNKPAKLVEAKQQVMPLKSAEPKESGYKVKESIPVRDLAYRGREWVVAQSPSSYAAQLLGSYSKKTAVKFIDQAGEVEPSLYYLKTLYKGRDWYVVFYGNFSSKKLAQKAILTAPKVVSKQGPWLRRFDGILSSYPK